MRRILLGLDVDRTILVDECFLPADRRTPVAKPSTSTYQFFDLLLVGCQFFVVHGEVLLLALDLFVRDLLAFLQFAHFVLLRLGEIAFLDQLLFIVVQLKQLQLKLKFILRSHWSKDRRHRLGRLRIAFSVRHISERPPSPAVLLSSASRRPSSSGSSRACPVRPCSSPAWPARTPRVVLHFG